MTASRLLRPVRAARQVADTFLGWWVQELRGLLPKRLSTLLGTSATPSISLNFAATGSVLVLPATRKRAATTIPVSHEGMVSGTVRLPRVENVGPGTPVLVSLDKSLLLETELDLPSTAERVLSSVVGHQIGKFVPLEPAQVSFDARVIRHSPDGKRIRVRLVAAKRATIERAVESARSLGLSPREVTEPVADLENGRPHRRPAAVLWRAEQGSGRRQAGWRLKRGLEGVCALLLLGSYVLHVHALSSRAADLRAELAAAKRSAADTQALAARIASMREGATLLQQRRLGPTPLRILAELSTLLPDDAWSNQLKLHGRTVELTGYAAQATSVISLLQSSPLFGESRFRSPITSSLDGKGERFDIVSDLRAAP